MGLSLARLLLGSSLLAAGLASCTPGGGGTTAGSGGPGGRVGSGGIDLPIDAAVPVSIEVTGAVASVDIDGTTPKTVAFTAMLVYSDTTKSPATGVTWSLDDASLGAINASGVFSTGDLGGVVQVTASAQALTGSAPLTIRLVLTSNAASADPNTQIALRAAAQADGVVTWAYPYDGTVWPRGLPTPDLMWNGGNAADIYRLHVTAPTLDYEAFITAPPPARVSFAGDGWFKITQSISGAASFEVARWNGAAATVVTKQAWTIAPGSLRGTVYYKYFLNLTAQVVRIKPGAAAPEQFIASTGAGGCSSCHSVSANGNVLAIGGDLVFAGGSTNCEKNGVNVAGDCKSTIYDLVNAAYIRQDPIIPRVVPSIDYDRPWEFVALAPDGAYAIKNYGSANAVNRKGLFKTSDGTVVPNTGLDFLASTPTFSPDGKGVAYVRVTPDSDLHYFDIDLAALKISNDRLLAKAGGPDPSVAVVAWPSVTPDGKWVVYQRGVDVGSTKGGDLYFTSTAGGGAETVLTALDGTKYPFAAGDRDRHWNFEPTFAPIASGGYFWVVFASRRTYGNALTGGASTGFGQGVKQLWVAAIDLSPQPGADPSHPAFRLPGQDEKTLNARGFWAKDPCKSDGGSCGAGDECCSGFCLPPGDGGGKQCGPPPTSGCVETGNKCSTSGDCCDAQLCINMTCSLPAPK